ncbi:MAG: hypothetical protein AAF525_04755, partial [Pseudomonadota bacterium]
IVTLPISLWFKFERVQAVPCIEITRGEAVDVARVALGQRNFSLPDNSRALTGVIGAPNIQDRFVWELSGEATYESLVDSWLHPPRYTVRFAQFEGDIAERAEEWLVYVSGDGSVRNVMHNLPEDAAGATLTEEDARLLATRTIEEELGFRADSLKEISVAPERHPNRTDWGFTFEYTGNDSLPALPDGGQYRVFATIAGDGVASYGRYVYVPEEWARKIQGDITGTIISVLTNVLVIGSLVVAAIMAIVVWSRGRFPVRLFWWTLGAMLVTSLLSFGNNFPIAESAFFTSQSYGTQILTVAIGGVIGMGALSAALGLAGGLGGSWRTCRTNASDLQLILTATALGCCFVGSRAIMFGAEATLPNWPVTGPAGTYAPWGATLLAGVLGLIRLAIFTVLLVGLVDRFSQGWTEQRGLAVLVLFLAGGIAYASTSSNVITTWLLYAALSGVMLVIGYIFLARYDLAVVPVWVGTVLAINIATNTAEFPGDTLAAILGSLVVFVTGIGAFLLLRQSTSSNAMEGEPI